VLCTLLASATARIKVTVPNANKVQSTKYQAQKVEPNRPMELNLLLTLDLREQAALQAALVTHGAPDALVTLALTGACRIGSMQEARQLRKWLAEARTAGETDFASLHVIEKALIDFGV
jgi:hypothetical protein